ncbi:MAG: hypothetical protein WAL67_09560 [Candidatus Cybelea sp.]
MWSLDSCCRAAHGCVAAAVLSGCGAPFAQTGANTSIPSGVPITDSNLLYVSSEEQIDLYTYPQGKSVGSLGIAGTGICADRAGNVFIPLFWYNEILEYAHGGNSPIATLETARNPADCAIDPATGTLAVTISDGIQTFSHRSGGWGPPQTYTQPDGTQVSYCAYDSSGDLFLDGYTSGSTFSLIEMPAGGSGTFTTVSLNKYFEFAGGLFWDHGELMISDSQRNQPTVIYQFKIAGNRGSEVGSTVLNHGTRSDRFLIHASTVVTSTRHGVGFWPYPAGGDAKRVLRIDNGFYGVALSVARGHKL